MTQRVAQICRYTLVLLLALAGFTPGFAQTKKGKTKSESTTTRTEKDMRVTAIFMDACKEKMLGNFDDAASRFYECIKIDATHAASMFELAGILLEKNKREEALMLVDRARQIDPNNEWYARLSAEISGMLGNVAQTEKIYRDLVKKHPRNIEFKYDLSNALLSNNKLKEAVAVYDQIEEVIGVSEEISVQKEKILLELNDLDGAVRELEKLIANYPNEIQYLNMLAQLFSANDQADQAAKVFERMINLDSSNPDLNFALADHYRNLKDNEKAFIHLKKAFEGQEVDIDRKVQVMLSFFNISEGKPDMLAKAYELLAIMERVNSDEAKTYAIKADFLYRDRKLPETQEAFLQTIKLDSSRFPIWLGLVNVDFELADHAAMLRHSQTAIELFPNQGQMHFLYGMALSRNKKWREAIDALKTAETYLRNEPGLLAQTLSVKAECHHERKEYAESDLAFDRALQLEPSNALFLNNYAYYLAERGDRLAKAEEMTKRANSLSPGNPSFEDTYAWVLFKLDKAPEALIWIEKALKNGGEKSGTVVEHYGDILYALGRKAEAIDQWKKAQALGDVSDALPTKVRTGKLD